MQRAFDDRYFRSTTKFNSLFFRPIYVFKVWINFLHREEGVLASNVVTVDRYILLVRLVPLFVLVGQDRDLFCHILRLALTVCHIHWDAALNFLS